MYTNEFTCPQCGVEYVVEAEHMLGRPETPLRFPCYPCLFPKTLRWIKEEPVARCDKHNLDLYAGEKCGHCDLGR